jgi:hypothetical protein
MDGKYANHNLCFPPCLRCSTSVFSPSMPQQSVTSHLSTQLSTSLLENHARNSLLLTCASAFHPLFRSAWPALVSCYRAPGRRLGDLDAFGPMLWNRGCIARNSQGSQQWSARLHNHTGVAHSLKRRHSSRDAIPNIKMTTAVPRMCVAKAEKRWEREGMPCGAPQGHLSKQPSPKHSPRRPVVL